MRVKKNEEIRIPKDYKLSEIRKICKKQSGCERCAFTTKLNNSGICLFSPIGISPQNWIFEEEINHE